MSNKMQQVAEILGVQMGEEFNIKNTTTGNTYDNLYKITERGLYTHIIAGVWGLSCMGELNRILTGDFEVVKISTMPKAMEAHDEFLRGRFLRVE